MPWTACVAQTDVTTPTYGPWRSSRIGGGGYLQNVVLCPSDPRRVYSYMDVGGAFRSDDGGRTWRMIHGGLPAKNGVYEVRGLSVDPRNADRVLIAVGSQWVNHHGIYLSEDGGVTWTLTQNALFSGNGPRRATGFLLTRHPNDPLQVIAASEGGGIWHSLDGGRTWTNRGLPSVGATDIRYDARDPNRLWLCAQPYNGWVGGKRGELTGGFYRSEDGGRTWRKLSDASPTETVQDPIDGRLLYGIFESRAIQVSADAGETWADASQGLPQTPPRENDHTSPSRFNALAAGPDFVLTASTRGDFYRRGRNDNRWQKIERVGTEFVYVGEQWYHDPRGFGWALGSITVDPRDPNHWFFTDWFAIYETRNAGRNWRLSIDGIEATVLHTLVQDPTDPGVVHLGMADNGYFHSPYGGSRFYGAERGISNNVKSIAVSPKLPSRLYATGPKAYDWEANQVFVSIDRGRNWTRAPMTGLPQGEAYKYNTIAVDPERPYTVYAAVSGDAGPGAGGIYRSTDGGKSWAWFGEGLPAGKPFYRASIWDPTPTIAVSTSGAMVTVSRDAGGVFRRGLSATQWTRSELTTRGTFATVVADPLRPNRFFVAAGYDALYRSDDAGTTWKRVLDRPTTYVAADGVVAGRVAAGTADGVYLSRDGGETWSEMDKRLPHRTNNIVAFTGERLLAGSSGNGCFWMPLSPAGEKDPVARGAQIMPASDASTPAPAFANGSMTEGTDRPAGWGTPWTGSGRVTAARDTTDFKIGPASLRLQSDGGPAYGSVSRSLTMTGVPFRLSGHVRSAGALQEAVVAIRVTDEQGKQIGWISLVDVRDARDWREFTAEVTLPPGARRADLTVVLRGDGKVWVDELRTEVVPAVFP